MKIFSKKIPIILAVIIGVSSVVLLFARPHFLSLRPPKNIPITVFLKDQGDPQLASDGSGGAVIVWNDTRNGDLDIYAQRLDGKGRLRWEKDGLPVSKGFGDQRAPQLISNKKERQTIIVWNDTRNGDFDIYAQKIDSKGKSQWEGNGVPVIIMGGDQRDFNLITLREGLLVVWGDHRDGIGSIHAQRLDSEGKRVWDVKGIKLANSPNDQGKPRISALSADEFIVVWEELDSNLVSHIKAQKITKDGELKWLLEGISVTEASWDQVDPRVVSDNQGGALIVWEDRRSGKEQIYAQKIDKDGKVLWKNNGILLARSSQYQWHPELVSDAEGGALVVWKDDRAGNDDVYAQKIDKNGKILWGNKGFPLAAQKNDQSFIKIAKINQDWAGVVWKDARNRRDDIFAQIISLKEKKKKTKDGYPISLHKANQQDPQIVGGADNKAIIVWSDYRNGRYRDVYGAILSF